MNKIEIYNTLSRKKEILEVKNPPYLNIYSCGPTVYDHSHIGHARAGVTWDFVVRFLRFCDYEVKWTRNITDIDDKIINKAKELNQSPQTIARNYLASFYEDMINLNISWPDYEPRATQFLPQMFNFIEALIQKNLAYKIKNDVYFSVGSFKKYGSLKGQSISELEKGYGRIEPNPKKKHPLDFALWKSTNEPLGYGFKSPWGKGRPGWHLECSAMNHAIYGDNLDIHCGGDDLIFPHHENEIAQSESYSAKQFARYWLHNGMIMVDGKKMAKSEGNFITIKEALKETTGNALRFFILNSHYKMPLNFTTEAITAAQNGINRLQEATSDFDSSNNVYKKVENEFTKEFTKVMSDDFNSPQALSILFKLTDLINTEKKQEARLKLQQTLLYLSDILGFNLMKNEINTSTKDKIFSKIIDKLISWRTECKNNKDYKSADKIRDILNECKIEVKDLADSTYKWQIKP